MTDYCGLGPKLEYLSALRFSRRLHADNTQGIFGEDTQLCYLDKIAHINHMKMAKPSPALPSLMSLNTTRIMVPVVNFSNAPAIEVRCLRCENREPLQGSSLWGYEKTQVKQIGFALPDTYSAAGFVNAQEVVADIVGDAPDTHFAAGFGAVAVAAHDTHVAVGAGAVANLATALDSCAAAGFGFVSEVGVAAAVEADTEFAVLAHQQPSYHCAIPAH